MEMFLLLNGYELIANTNEQEQIILNLAAGKLSKEIFTDWVQKHIFVR